VSAPGTAKAFLKEHINKLSVSNDIYLVVNGKFNIDQIKDLNVKEIKSIPIYRGINIWYDFVSLFLLTLFFKKKKFDIIHSVTPKAGLLSALAGYISKIPHRVHIFTGQVWATKTGFRKKILMNMDRLIARLNTDILVDGYSQQKFLIDSLIVSEDKSRVLARGSISGVNLNRFSPVLSVRNEQRMNIGISNEKVVFVYLGRINKEKGIFELLESFNKVAENFKEAYLLIVGKDESKCLEIISKFSEIKLNENFFYYGFTKKPELVLQAGDVFVLPSYREGFGLSVIESASLGLPAICSDIYGLNDAIVDKVTGIKCKVRNVESLKDAMISMIEDSNFRIQLGLNARKRIIQDYSSEIVTNAWLEFYNKMSI
jgi:glycosyltransferase involved in cell wall biosynthesis